MFCNLFTFHFVNLYCVRDCLCQRVIFQWSVCSCHNGHLSLNLLKCSDDEQAKKNVAGRNDAVTITRTAIHYIFEYLLCIFLT